MNKLILSLLLLTQSSFALANGPSYGELGKSRIMPAWHKVESELTVLHKKTLPHEAKNVRKLIANLREQIDLFVYAYPKKNDDLWAAIRDDLDEGYETIGIFKDLFDMQEIDDPSQAEYDEKELKKQRQRVLQWQEKWFEQAEKYASYLQDPLMSEISIRKKKDLSRFYWGSTELVPDVKLSGEENLRALSIDLLQLAEKDWKTVKKIKNPAKSHQLEAEFHDFRKRLRSVVRILRTTGEIYRGSEADLATMEDIVGKYGAINDKIVARIQAEKNGKENKSERLFDEIGELWSELVDQQNEIEIDEVLRRVRAGLR